MFTFYQLHLKPLCELIVYNNVLSQDLDLVAWPTVLVCVNDKAGETPAATGLRVLFAFEGQRAISKVRWHKRALLYDR